MSRRRAPMPRCLPRRRRSRVTRDGRSTRVACDPRRSVVVEACAGAGKTWMLVSRILRALLDGAQPQRDPRDHLHAQGGRRDARAARRVAARVRRGRRRDAARRARCVERGARRRRRRARSRRAAALHERAAARRPRGRDPHLPRLVRAAAARGAARRCWTGSACTPSMELIEDLDDHCGRRCSAASTRRCWPTPRCAPTTPRWSRGTAAPAAQVAGRGAGQARRARAGRRGRRARRQRAAAGDRAMARTRLAAPCASACATPLRERRALALALGMGACQARAEAALRSSGAGASRRRTAFRRALCAGAVHAEGRAAQAARRLPSWPTRLRRCRRDRDALAQQDAHVDHLRMVRLSRVLLAAYRGATSARAAWPTWPTSSAARWRCCATRRSPAGCRSGSTRACATC